MDAQVRKPSDAAGERLHELGYSYGHTASRGPGGESWSVYAHKGEHRIVTHSPDLVKAYRDAIEQARVN